MTVDRLRHQAVLADALEQHLSRNLAFAEARDLDARREIRRGVLDRVVHVMRRHLNRQPDTVLGKLFDLGLHLSIQAGPFWAGSRG